jgi:hypothetical protein
MIETNIKTNPQIVLYESYNAIIIDIMQLY